jgi:hypothetical protein
VSPVYGGQMVVDRPAVSTPLRRVLVQEHAARRLREMLAVQVKAEGGLYGPQSVLPGPVVW